MQVFGERVKLPFACLLSLLLLSGAALPGPTVQESAREIPVAYDVDVVVVGGSTGAVAAAVRATEAGARVFLAAPLPYLGEDMTATLRLWLEEGEIPTSPLGRKLFSDVPAPAKDPNALPFTYQADVSSGAPHKDTRPPSRLSDGEWGNASQQSVQYDSDVTIIADLSRSREIEKIRVIGYRRNPSSKNSFDVARIVVSVSDDKNTWKPATVLEQPTEDGDVIQFRAPLPVTTRYVRLEVKKPSQVQRILLGEIELVGKAPVPTDPPRVVWTPPRPLYVKKTLDEALLKAGVPFLYGCFATDVLRDAAGDPCGIVMANRSGRQAVVARTIIDATERGWVARLAGAQFQPYPVGKRSLKRVVIGGEPRTGSQVHARVINPPYTGLFPNPAKTSSGEFKVIEYTLDLPIREDSFAAWAAADQQARTLTYHPQQQFTSDRLFEVPPDALLSRQAATGPWPGPGKIPLTACQPAEVRRVYLIGGCVAVPRPWAEKLVRPLALIDLGTQIGAAAAKEAKSLPAPKAVRASGTKTAQAQAAGEVQEILQGIRPGQKQTSIPQEARDLPVLGSYDVVVVGGGTGGAPAGIAAGRTGAKTLVLESQHGLGGVGTLGAIASYYWGNRVGFSATVLGGSNAWIPEQKAEWWRNELLKAEVDVWFGTTGCGAVVKDSRVRGVVVATPRGRGVVLARAVIDATGNADIAAAAGARTDYTDASEFGMQGTGLPGLKLGGTYNNTDFTITDETDLVDIWQLLVFAKNKYPQAFDQGKLIDTRERRRIVGDFTITLLDQVNQRTYPDSVVRAYSNFDSHGYTIDPYTLVEHPQHKGFYVYVPFRAMLPAGLEGVLVIGLGISAHRDAVPLIRMQADIQNGGYAAGLAAATAARYDTPLRKLDIRALQAQLVDIGNLPASVLTDKDSYPLSEARIAEAVKELPEGRGAGVILAEPSRALPLLKKAYSTAAVKDRPAYARLLAILGDPTGADLLKSEVKQTRGWDEGWNYKGMGQFGNAFSPLDISIVALGRSRDPQAVPVIVEKLNQLTAESDFSHHRAVGLALELIGHPSAARPLAELLARPGMTGHAQTSIEKVIERETPGGTNAVTSRRESLRELVLARALYRCGDHDGVGKKILETYTQDLRGHLARHARAVLTSPGGERPRK